VAAPAELRYLLAGLVEGKYVEDGYVGSGFGEADGEGLSEAASCAGYEGGAAVQPEVVEDGHQ
jgi:hypothetical protein